MNIWTVEKLYSLYNLTSLTSNLFHINQKFGDAVGILTSNSQEAIAFAELNHRGFMNPTLDKPFVEVLAFYEDNLHFELPESTIGIPHQTFLYKKGVTYHLKSKDTVTIDELGRIHLVTGNRHLLLLSPIRKDDIRYPARILREILAYDSLSYSVRLHGGAAIAPEGAFLILGNKGAGKTTLLTSILDSDASFCANDRIVTGLDDKGELSVVGLPTTIRIGSGTCLSDSRMSSIISCKEWSNSLVYSDINQVNQRDDKIELTPLEFCRVLGCSIKGKAQIVSVLIPELDLNNTRLQLLSVSHEHKMSYLKNSLLHPDPAFPRYFDKKEWKVTPDILQKIIALPWIKVRGLIHSSGILNEIRKKVFT